MKNKSGIPLLIIGQAAFAIVVWATLRPKVIPSPLEVLRAIPILWYKGLGFELYQSFVVNITSLLLAFGLSLLLSYSTALPGSVGPFFRPVAQFVSKLRFLSLVGLTYLFTLMTPSGHALKIALLVFGVTVFMVTSLNDVISAIPKERFDDARTLRMGPWRVVLEVVVLGTFADALGVFRQCAAMSFMMLTLVEGLVRSEGGIGAMLLVYDKYFVLQNVFAIQFCILLVGVGMDYGIGWLRRKLCPYAYLTLERK